MVSVIPRQRRQEEGGAPAGRGGGWWWFVEWRARGGLNTKTRALFWCFEGRHQRKGEEEGEEGNGDGAVIRPYAYRGQRAL